MSDRDVAVKTLIVAYRDVLRRLRGARAERDGITEKIFEHFLEWTEEKGEKPFRYVYGLIDEFYDEMGITDPSVKKGLTRSLQVCYRRRRSQHE